MSLILDALNRADQERTEENHTPSLHANHSPAPEIHRAVPRRMIAWVIVCVAIGAFAYLLWPESTADSAGSQAEPAAVTAISAAAETTQPTPQQRVTTTPTKEAAAEQAMVATGVVKPTAPDTHAAIASLYNKTGTKEKLVTASVAAAVTKPTASSPQRDTSITLLYEEPATKQKAIAPAISNPATVNVAEDVDNSLLILRQIPLITEQSSIFQRSIPNIYYTVHVYSEEDGAGFVTINDKIIRPGSQVEPGLRLIAILNDSIVLDSKGKKFRLPALNSWINYN